MIGRNLGRYRILSELGRGGMGVVYRATQTTLDRTVAIKMLSPHLADSGDHLQRFRREAEVLARLQHENIVHIYDVVEVEGSFCIVMEFVAGPSLGEVLAQSGRLDEARAREIGVQLASGLEAAHRKGVVHRDLKPDNVLMTPEGRARITDFGIARIAGDDAMARTRTGILLGTPWYMSPEQARGDEITGASDQYALGVLLYQMLSGHVPFDGNDPISVAIKHMHETPTPLAEAAPGVHPELAAVVARAMARDPAERYASAGEMARVLRQVRLDEEVPADMGSASGGVPIPSAWPPGPVSGPPPGPVSGPVSGPPSGPVSGPPSDSGWDPGPRPLPPPLAAAIDDALAAATSVGGALRRRLEVWSRPAGRWNVPPLLWAGVILVGMGLSLGLARAVWSPSDAGGSAERGGTLTAGAPGEATVAAAGGASGGAAAPRGGAAGAPDFGFERSLPASGGAQAGGAVPRPEIGGTPPSNGTVGAPDAANDTSDDTTGDLGNRVPPEPPRPNDPPPVDHHGALEALVERQRRATESGDAALFRQDLSDELARVNLPFLAQLHQGWTGLQSEVTNLAVELGPDSGGAGSGGGPRVAQVDFHTRLSGIPRGGGTRQLIEDTHVYWTLVRESDRWVVMDARSAPHGELR